MTPKKLWIWNLVLMFLPLVITLMILPHLPNQIPAHYGFDGQVDRWGSKYKTLVVPLLAVITGGILLLVAKLTVNMWQLLMTKDIKLLLVELLALE